MRSLQWVRGALLNILLLLSFPAASSPAEELACAEPAGSCSPDEAVQLQLHAGVGSGRSVQRRWAPAREEKASATRAVGAVGRVDAVWGFGRAGVSKEPLEDEVHGGCFPGLNTFVTYGGAPDLATVALEYFKDYKFGKQRELELQKDHDDFVYHDCTHPMKLAINPAKWCKNPLTCHKGDYEHYFLDADRLPSDQGVLKAAIALTWDMHYFYQGDYNVHYLATSAKSRGWELVGRIKAEGWFIKDYDTVNMYQHPQTLECLIVFECTEPGDWHAILSWDDDVWCGHDGVHHGFVYEIRSITGSPEWQSSIKPKLGSCSKVHATGHSMGGTLAEMFAYCANKNATPAGKTKGDFEQITWTTEAPKRLTPWSDMCIKPFTRYDTDILPGTEAVETASAEECQARCKATFGCAYFSWTKECKTMIGHGCSVLPHYFKDMCTLHDSASVALTGERDTISSAGPDDCLAETLPCVQGGLRWKPATQRNSTGSAEECQALCSATSGCAHFTWKPPGYFKDLWGSAGECQLSGRKALPVPFEGALSGPPSCALAWTCLEPMHLYEPRLEGARAAVAETVWHCQNRCEKALGCMFFSYRAEDGSCHLAGRNATARWDKAFIGGPPRCPEKPHPDAVRQ